MPNMYDALLKAAKNDPDFEYELKSTKRKMDAETAMRKRKQLEAAAKRLEAKKKAAEKKQRQKAERQAAENERKERERIQKQWENMASLQPFSYNYAHFGTYSFSVGVVLAQTLYEAEEKMKSILMSDEFHGPGSSDPKSLEELRLRVEPMDLSRGWCGIFEYIE